MNISMQVVIVVAAVCLCLADGAPEARLTRKQQRPTRGFKNVEMMTARGFGKRDRSVRTERDVGHQPSPSRSSRGTPTFKSPTVGIARDFGKRAPELELEGTEAFEARRKVFRPKVKLMVAPDYGKRSGNDEINDEEEEIRVTRGTFKPYSNILIARGYGKRDLTHENGRVFGLDNVWDSLENNPERDNQEFTDDKVVESIPLDWFVNEMVNNPDFARSVIRKFIDINQDGLLSPEELLRNVA
ncbi:allatotropin-like isoform X1 [Battus philenor]|uniref:allatotropin-like isoform X1 n=1 Tax=Battus philenor TaxID=42288 RepID=UPI0035D04C4C